jgi:hypothetical protein
MQVQNYAAHGMAGCFITLGDGQVDVAIFHTDRLLKASGILLEVVVSHVQLHWN